MQQLTRDLYEAMVLPLEPALKPGNRLLVVLPTHMPAFSLAGLRRGGTPSAPALCERCALSYLPTVRFVQSVKPGRVQTRVVAALGVRGATTWDVEYELRDINAFYRSARMLFGKEATLASLQSVHADLLHLAVEVRFSAHRPMTGSLLLGDGETSDGTLVYPLATLFALPPFAGVVVSNLSGKLPTTDCTLAAAFLSNGAFSVVTNAAPLSRKTKMLFGESFYTALQTGVPVSMAFRTAQNGLAQSKEMSATTLWAPLMVWGR
jgi:CHAT domain-containing protein